MQQARSKVSPSERMLHLISGSWVSQLLYVAAKLKIADALARGPLTPEDVARRVGASAPAIRRILRALASMGVFAECADGRRVRLTPLAQMLRDQRGSWREFAIVMGDAYGWKTFGSLLHGVTTGECPFEHAHGMPPFEYLKGHRELEVAFARMQVGTNAKNDRIARAYAFGKLSSLVDVAGSHGHLLAAILRRHRKLQGVLFDQPQVIAQAKRSGLLSSPGLRGRCSAVGGDFFKALPQGADGYLLRFVLHDWSDRDCCRILRNCRSAMAPGGRVIVIEHVIKRGNAPDFGKLTDIAMLAFTEGRERALQEYRGLFVRAGLRLRRAIAVASPLSESASLYLMEAVRA